MTAAFTPDVADCDVPVRSIKVVGNACIMQVACPPLIEGAGPGTFVMVRSLKPGSPPLGRPISIVRTEGGMLDLVFNIVGEGTRALAALSPGEPVAVVGPLGNTFSDMGPRPVIVVDALHVGTMIAVARHLSEAGIAAPAYFARHGLEAEPLLIDVMRDAGAAVVDGPASGVTPFLEQSGASFVSVGAHDETTAAAQAFCASTGTPGEAALQAVMGCGLGVCQSCIRPRVEGGMFLVCERPVVPIAFPSLEAGA